MFKRFSDSFRPMTHQPRRRPSQSPLLNFETLEDRRLLATFTVTNNTDAPVVAAGDLPGSLRQAIFDANANPGADTITFDGNVFTGGVNSLIRIKEGGVLITEELTIDGSSATDVVITGDANGDDITFDGTFITDVAASFDATTGTSDDFLDDNSFLLNFSFETPSVLGTLSLSSVTLTGGSLGGVRTFAGSVSLNNSNVSGNFTTRSSRGGGIYTRTGEVSLTNSIVSDNHTGIGGLNGGSGGGIHSFSGNIYLVNSTLNGNSTSSSGGGGIFTIDGNVSLINSTLSGNSTGDGSQTGGGYGGGIRTFAGNVSLIDSMLIGNSTSSNNSEGGGISVSRGSISLLNSVVSGNSTSGDRAEGGGIRAGEGNVSLTNSTISGNSTSGNDSPGGGIWISQGDVSLNNSTISGNNTYGDDSNGGGIWSFDSPLLIDNSTIAENSASGVGGGVILDSDNSSDVANVTIINSIVANNADDGTAPDFSLSENVETNFLIEYSLIGDSTGSRIVPTTGFGNILDQPALLGPLADNGGPTQTHSLLFGSPAIDAGNSLLTIDQRGIAREINFTSVSNSPIGDGSDIGAFELQTLVPSDIVVVVDKTSALDFSSAEVVEEGGIVAVTLVASAGTFSPPADGSGIGDGVTAILTDPQTIALVGSATDINSYFDSVTNLFYTPAIGAIDENAATFSVTVDVDGSTREFSINVDIRSLQVDTVNDADNLFDGGTSLREAINVANIVPGADTITFDANVFFGGVSSLIRLGMGELEIKESLTIDATGATGVVITGDIGGDDPRIAGTFLSDISASTAEQLDDNSRVLNFLHTTGDSTLIGLAISGGSTSGDNVAGETTYSGGGIRFLSSGTLSVVNSTIGGNSTSGSFADGGGIFSQTGNVVLVGSTISGNSSVGEGAYGGGIFSESGVVSLDSSTVSFNEGNGGGIALSPDSFVASSQLTVESSIVARNTFGGALDDILIHDGASQVTVSHSLIGVNRGTSLAAAPFGSLDANGNLIGTLLEPIDPLLLPLSDNGGLTLTHALQLNSPAVDAGNSNLATDQRGMARQVDFASISNSSLGNGSDIGAFEMQTLTGAFPTERFVFADTTNNLDLSSALVVNEFGGITTVTLVATGAFSVPTDGSGVGDGVAATLVNPQTITLVGAAVDINSYLDNTSSLQYTPVAGEIGNNATTISVLVNVGPTQNEFIINVDIREQQSLVVTTRNDWVNVFDGVTSLREAIRLANQRPGADEITFDDGVFIGFGNSLVRFTLGELEVTDSLTIDASTATDVVISGDRNGDDWRVNGTYITDLSSSTASRLDDNTRVLNFSDASGDLTLVGLTITGGRTTDNNGPGDYTQSGGGIRFVSNGVLTLSDSIVSGNSTVGYAATGGGVYTNTGNVALTNTALSDNSTSSVFASGGGIYTRSGSVSLTNSELTGNHTVGGGAYGGGIYSRFGEISLTQSALSNNRTQGYSTDGGGVFVSSGSVSLTNSLLSGNSAIGDSTVGGGVFLNSGNVTLINSTVSGNEATSYGGGVFLNIGTMAVINSTVTENSVSAGSGGGIRFRSDLVGDGSLTLINSIVAGNTDDGTAPDILAIDVETGSVVEHSLIGDTSGSGITATTGNGNVLNQPALLGPLTDNGGSTLTHALLPGSPAIDAGSDEALDDLGVTLTTDQRWPLFVRTFDDPDAAGSGVDIGAFERQFLTLVVDNQGDETDGDFSEGELTLREAVDIANDLANNAAGPDTIMFDRSVFIGGAASVIRLTQGELEITEELTIDGSAGTDVLITGDANGDDVTVSGTYLTDVAASFGGSLGGVDDLLHDNSRVLRFTGEMGNLMISGLTLTGGRTTADNRFSFFGNPIDISNGGAGVRFESSGVLTLSNSTVSGNSTYGDGAAGGGIYTTSGEVSLTGTTLTGNHTAGRGADGGGIRTNSGFVSLTNSILGDNSTSGVTATGGGISTSSGDVSLINSTISGNSTSGDGSGGGGIYFQSGDVSLINSNLSGNSTSGYSEIFTSANGGGIGNARGFPIGSVTLIDSTLSGNWTSGLEGQGGGIYTELADVSLINSSVTGNSTSGIAAHGGGISTRGGAVSLFNSTLSGNSTSGSSSDGGGIFSAFTTVQLNNSTITDNSTAGTGGGIGSRTDRLRGLTIRNSIIAGNTDNGTAPDFSELLTGDLVVEHSLIGDTTGSGVTATTGNRNILNQPALLGSLTDNGGPTLTHALLPGSPAIDAGSDTLAVDADGIRLTTDQRGTGFDRIKFGRVDIGAFESDFDAPPIAPSVLSATVDEGGELARPDLWNTLTIVFDTDVTVAASDLSLFNDSQAGTAVVLSGIGFNYDSSSNTATWDFTTLANPLEAAFYTWRLNASSILSNGLALDGNGDGTGGDNFVDQHYVAIPGDRNLDGVVDVDNDLQPTIGNLGTTQGAVWSDGDFNGDGAVDVVADVLTLMGNLNKSVVPVTGPVVLLGDVNQDDAVNFLDISPFISILSTNVFQAEADVNQDGVVDFLDISPFIGVLSSPGTSQLSFANLMTASSDLSHQANDEISVEFDATPSGPTLLRKDVADAQLSVRAWEPSLLAYTGGSQEQDGSDSLNLRNEIPVSNGESVSVPSMTDGFSQQVKSSDLGSRASFSYQPISFRATSDLSILTVPLSAGYYRASIFAGSVSNSNNGQNLLRNYSDEFFLALAGDVNLDGNVDVVNDVHAMNGNLGASGNVSLLDSDFNNDEHVDAHIVIDTLGSSVAIDVAFAQLDL